jgi:signal transduction histidine kinase
VPFRLSLYWRLTLALLGPLLLAMVAAWAIGAGAVTKALEQRVERQSRNAAQVLAAWGLPYTPELLRRLAALQQADFVLLDRGGRVVVSTSDDVGRALEKMLQSPSNTLRTDGAMLRLQDPSPSVAVYQQISASHDPRYSALIAVSSLTDATAAARRAALWLGLAMLAAAALLAVLLLALVRNITQPLAQLSTFADRIAAGERRQRLELPRADEIGALTASLNSMMERLAGYEAQLSSRSRLAALGDMSARLAHEIRNPLTGIKLHLQLMAERAGPREVPRLQQLLHEVQRLELLVSSTLMLGAEQPLRPEPMDLAAVAEDVLDLMRPSFEHRGIAVEAHVEQRPALAADLARVRQALLNLLVNAADAMPQGGRLRVSTSVDAGGRCAVLAVEDSGPGVSDEIRARLLESSVSTKPFGLGLGLAVCRDVAAAHGGELRVGRSESLGGALFAIALPLPPAAPPATRGV